MSTRKPPPRNGRTGARPNYPPSFQPMPAAWRKCSKPPGPKAANWRLSIRPHILTTQPLKLPVWRTLSLSFAGLRFSIWKPSPAVWTSLSMPGEVPEASLSGGAVGAVEEWACLPPSRLSLAGVGSRGSRQRGPEDRHAAHRPNQRQPRWQTQEYRIQRCHLVTLLPFWWSVRPP